MPDDVLKIIYLSEFYSFFNSFASSVAILFLVCAKQNFNC